MKSTKEEQVFVAWSTCEEVEKIRQQLAGLDRYRPAARVEDDNDHERITSPHADQVLRHIRAYI